ncbi:MAG TPA: carbohydrate-binding family 9-like protein [Gemmatimonadales bacterium]|jgi:hypothetical protein
MTRPAVGLAACALLMMGCGHPVSPAPATTTTDQTIPRPAVQAAVPRPREYLTRRTLVPPVIDGNLDDAAWRAASWTDFFVDIEGAVRAAPRFRTRAKMLWDDNYWYIAAEIQEPDLWATVTHHDDVIFRDNDFEIFVDPSGTTHRYFEIEMNQLGTEWDLFLPKPYRDNGSAQNSWEIPGLKLAVAVNGTLNHPGDRDQGWSVEVAIPWRAFADSGRNVVPPTPGTQWRMNFSRVEWDVDTAAGSYHKRTDATGKPLPEHNWVWTPQGAINMHIPEMWGVVQFGGSALAHHPADDAAKWSLRRVYYAERSYHQSRGSYATTLTQLGLGELARTVTLHGTATSWNATDAGWQIDRDGRVWRQ